MINYGQLLKLDFELKPGTINYGQLLKLDFELKPGTINYGQLLKLDFELKPGTINYGQLLKLDFELKPGTINYGQLLKLDFELKPGTINYGQLLKLDFELKPGTINYGQLLKLDFELKLGTINYGQLLKLDFELLDGTPPKIIGIYAKDETNNTIQPDDTQLKIGAVEVKDDNGLAWVRIRYGINDDFMPYVITIPAPENGPISNIWSPVSFTQGDRVYYQISAEDIYGNYAKSNVDIYIVPGPIAYGQLLKLDFEIIKLAPKEEWEMIWLPAGFPLVGVFHD